jgi:DNA repair protein RecN (Recombination protein N)
MSRRALIAWRDRTDAYTLGTYVLRELTIRNFALLEVACLHFGTGLTVLTGETGAGKSIVIDAIGCVLGGRTSAEIVRAGTDRAFVEAIFDLDPDTANIVRTALDGLGIADLLEANDESGVGMQLVLAREIAKTGRSVARINGRAVPASSLAQIGDHLIDIHGQHDHLSLLRADAQRDLLDRFGGHDRARRSLADQWRDLSTLRATRRQMQTDEREVARRLDMLGFQVEEITQANLIHGEDDALLRERARLANAGRLAELGATILGFLGGGEDGDLAARDLVARAARDLDALTRVDPDVAPTATSIAEASTLIDDAIHTITAYVDSIEFNPARQAEVERRLDQIGTLKYKYGATIVDILAYADRARAELEELATRDARGHALDSQIAVLEASIGSNAAALSQARVAVADRLAADIASELRALSLKGAFEALLTRAPDPDGVPTPPDGARWRCDETGIDSVAFHFAPNPGEPSRPVARTASGGELSRILLALKAVLSRVDRTPTLIFDEIDTGVGGRNAQVLGEKLSGLGDRHQVFCVTHLPQVAAYADGHIFLAKHVTDGRTSTEANALDGEGRVTELAQMLGGTSQITLVQARELIDRATTWKRMTRVPAA